MERITLFFEILRWWRAVIIEQVPACFDYSLVSYHHIFVMILTVDKIVAIQLVHILNLTMNPITLISGELRLDSVWTHWAFLDCTRSIDDRSNQSTWILATWSIRDPCGLCGHEFILQHILMRVRSLKSKVIYWSLEHISLSVNVLFVIVNVNKFHNKFIVRTILLSTNSTQCSISW